MTKQSKYGIASPTARNNRKSEGFLHGVYTEHFVPLSTGSANVFTMTIMWKLCG